MEAEKQHFGVAGTEYDFAKSKPAAAQVGKGGWLVDLIGTAEKDGAAAAAKVAGGALRGVLSWAKEKVEATRPDDGPYEAAPAYVYNEEVKAWIPSGMSAEAWLAEEERQRLEEEQKANPPPPPTFGGAPPTAGFSAAAGPPPTFAAAPPPAAGPPPTGPPPSSGPPPGGGAPPRMGPPTGEVYPPGHPLAGSPIGPPSGSRRPRARPGDHYRAQAGGR